MDFCKASGGLRPCDKAGAGPALVRANRPPKQALIVLALDPDPALATYVIHKAKSLTENDLLHIAQRGTAVQWHALADRTDLSALVVDFLMVFADSETRTRLKSNPSAPWSEPAANLFNRENKVPIPTVKTVCSRTNRPRRPNNRPNKAYPEGLYLCFRAAMRCCSQPASRFIASSVRVRSSPCCPLF